MKRDVTLKESIFLLVILMIIIGISIIGLDLQPQIPILFAVGIVIFFAKMKGASWDAIHKGIQNGIIPGLIPIIIFMLIGVLISVWISAGTIPTIMVYGLGILSAKFFLPSVFVICALVGILVGSSFTTISTIGIAFLGMGQMMEFNLAMTAGAIVSGAYVGNNISPLSDTANLASAIAEVDLFEHIRNMLRKIVPSFVISLIFFIIIGQTKVGATGNNINELVDTLHSNFNISIVSLIPALILFLCAWKKVPAIPTLLLSIIVTIVIHYIYYPHTSFSQISNLMQDGFVSNTGTETVDILLTRGGMQSMMWSVSLIILALSLGGLLVELKIIETLISKIQSLVSTKGKLILMAGLSAVGINIVLGEQYLSIILPGKAFKSQVEAININPKKLSAILADAGAVVNSLIPWGVSGVFITGTLGVPTLEYAPFAIFCVIAPIINVLSGFFEKEKDLTRLS
ncbi:Na+/H+ antiporter NhaC [Virgibacillus pantothenticus]|uniref:Sodium:proton antiporter n=1 Tax=Virgibacillus pantothenticus TaxID=1473 RepID=A0A0L0QKP5_VIRPA|nr:MULTISPECIES: Na+/H+ antiporter NhaC [Virgibacillus]API91394.1 Na+/H+ antiporter NhaC [Virgibacillus sp. 6R]KNE19157.1 sodium:proton antiporter [Virgibacillus pantothenticus]MBS7426636.1 Na+/H+ antiporter NhaC [Virgibacillus sp. 19R1-5]MBU8568504.1 Na+/H+ antiporter NhaC [Virgibacillus pantothenticus]MBU8599936.1 Na+/H+ antiporter NhaC [Virgibacillus pantothenticus]